MVPKKSLKDDRERTGSTVSPQDSYKFYRESLVKSKKPVDYKIHYALICRFNEIVADKIIEGKNIQLPANVGRLFASKSSHVSKRKNIDFGHYRKTGEVREHLNEHTDYMLLKVFFRPGKVSNILRYCFEPCRNLSRTLAKKAKEKGAEDFVEIKKVYHPKKKRRDDLPYDFE